MFNKEQVNQWVNQVITELDKAKFETPSTKAKEQFGKAILKAESILDLVERGSKRHEAINLQEENGESQRKYRGSKREQYQGS